MRDEEFGFYSWERYLGDKIVISSAYFSNSSDCIYSGGGGFTSEERYREYPLYSNFDYHKISTNYERLRDVQLAIVMDHLRNDKIIETKIPIKYVDVYRSLGRNLINCLPKSCMKKVTTLPSVLSPRVLSSPKLYVHSSLGKIARIELGQVRENNLPFLNALQSDLSSKISIWRLIAPETMVESKDFKDRFGQF